MNLVQILVNFYWHAWEGGKEGRLFFFFSFFKIIFQGFVWCTFMYFQCMATLDFRLPLGQDSSSLTLFMLLNSWLSLLQPYIGTFLLLQFDLRGWNLWYYDWNLIKTRSHTYKKMNFVQVLVNSYLHACKGRKDELVYFLEGVPKKLRVCLMQVHVNSMYGNSGYKFAIGLRR